ncbi:ABC-F family ATP-binding cassette domain-containing protein [Desulfosoma caldarium]|uniref:ATP-binding cassette subfamily F protein 3 n=1 Tax=Desulfosoma caldarium TaxID=610254 RepID=A0A3N1UMB1_9BACT|nr:ABC-F family ATP-binding cassette domain-containing protein [Desulfosoma caldarium]ROQ91213.1 ATP-binding cassette subfamily F protein 3 [Desulfosoma caldarium]
MIAVQNVSKFLGNKELFRHVSFHIHPGDRIGVVGPNGAGKTTLFRVLLGETDPDQGAVSRAKNLSLGYLPQQWSPPQGLTVLAHTQAACSELFQWRREMDALESAMAEADTPEEAQMLAERHAALQSRLEHLGPYDLEARAQRILVGLGFCSNDFHKPVASLSGGWAMRVELARLLLLEPDVLFLDEPTNHLDLESILWLEAYLQETRSAVLVVSHDRFFLNRVVRKILELENGRVEMYQGNFDVYVKEKALRRRILEAAKENQDARIRHIENFIARNRVRKDRARQVQSRLKMLEKIERLEAPGVQETVRFKFPEPERCGRRVLELVGVRKVFGNHLVYDGVDLVVERGDRIALLGPNGAGKSTLLKMLAGKEPVTEGEVRRGHNVKVGYYAQHLWEELKAENTVLEEVLSISGALTLTSVRTLLGAFLFKGDDVEKKVGVLSGGEKARLSLCKLLVQAPNVLLLDEPTNHLDIPGRQVLEDALTAYAGTVCFVSHDRHFINALANKFVVVHRNRLDLLPGNADDYERVWKRGIQGEENDGVPSYPTPLAEPEGIVKSKLKIKERKRWEAKRRNALYRQKKPLQDRLTALEKDLDRLHEERDRLSAVLADPATYHGTNDVAALQRRYRQCEEEISRVTAQWEETALALECLERQFAQDNKSIG